MDGMASLCDEVGEGGGDFDAKPNIRRSHDIVRKLNLGPNFDPGEVNHRPEGATGLSQGS